MIDDPSRTPSLAVNVLGGKISHHISLCELEGIEKKNVKRNKKGDDEAYLDVFLY